MNTYCVYKHVNRINNKQYIGLTRQNPIDRWKTNGTGYKYSCPHFWNAIKKYGWDNFDHIIVADGLTRDEACSLEMALIRENNTQNSEFGYNTLEGGTAPRIPDEVRMKMSASAIGNKNGLGHPCSEEKKRKISEAQKGKKLTEDHKRKLSEAKRGKHHSPPSEATRKKISNSHSKRKVYCQEKDTVYESVHECARVLKLWASLVSKCCMGKLKTTGGYHLEYYD